MRRLGAAMCAAVCALVVTPVASAQPSEGGHVVVFTLPGVTWDDVRRADTPTLDRLVREGAVADLAVRTATADPNPERGYLTLGAGNRAHVAGDDEFAHLAFLASDRFEGGAAADALARRLGRRPTGSLVHIGAPHIAALQRSRLYGTVIGTTGELLRRAGIGRYVVSAADVAVEPATAELRRAAVLGLIDRSGAVDDGVLDGLLEPNPAAPFGVSTDVAAFAAATRRGLESASVLLLEPGETLRADEFAGSAAPGRGSDIRAAALKRADTVLAAVVELLGPDDLLLVVSPAGPTYPLQAHLAPAIAWGRSEDGGWLTSASTRRDGQITLPDISATILDRFGVEESDEMIGTPVRSVPSAAGDRIAELIELDRASIFRETFSAVVFWVLAIGMSLLAVLAFLAFLGDSRRWFGPLCAVAYFGLAMFPAAHILRVLEYWHFGMVGAHAALYAIAALLAAAAWRLRGPRWAGAVALMLLSVVLFVSDVVQSGPLQVNGIFGHSPIVAGRFYGVSNPGYTIIFTAAILALTGLAELRRQRKLPIWAAVALVALVPVIALPQWGADFGGVLAGTAAVAATITLGRRGRIGWRWVVMVAVAAVLLAAALTAIDLARPPDVRTHLGRFAQTVLDGGPGALLTIVLRKASAAIGSLAVTRWTYFIPVGVAVLALLLLRPRGVLRDVIPRHPVLRAGLWGAVVTGAAGFAVNDSGISIPALVLAHAVPFLVLLAVETVAPRDKAGR